MILLLLLSWVVNGRQAFVHLIADSNVGNIADITIIIEINTIRFFSASLKRQPNEENVE